MRNKVLNVSKEILELRMGYVTFFFLALAGNGLGRKYGYWVSV